MHCDTCVTGEGRLEVLQLRVAATSTLTAATSANAGSGGSSSAAATESTTVAKDEKKSKGKKGKEGKDKAIKFADIDGTKTTERDGESTPASGLKSRASRGNAKPDLGVLSKLAALDFSDTESDADGEETPQKAKNEGPEVEVGSDDEEASSSEGEQVIGMVTKVSKSV